VGTSAVFCEDYNALENWSYGTNTFLVITHKTIDYQISYANDSWGELAAYGASAGSSHSWDLRLTQNLVNRADTGTINTTPITFTPLFITLPQNITYSMKIPFLDVDGDIVRCV
jgi:hypothetical protein